MTRRVITNLSWLVVGIVGVAAGAVWAVPQIRSVVPGMGTDETASSIVARIESVAHNGSSHATASLNVAKTRVEAVRRNVTLRLTGSLAADEKSDVACNTAGIVAEVHCDRGSLVKKGDLLVKLDPTDAQNALNEALAAVQELLVRLGVDNPSRSVTIEELLNFNTLMGKFNVNELPEVKAAKLAVDLESANFKRATDLYEKKFIATETYDKNRTDYFSAVERHLQAVRQGKQLYQNCLLAQARAATLLKALKDCVITAPFDGWVAERWVSCGERMVSMFPGAGRAVTLLRIDPLRLSLTVPQQHVTKVRPGAPVVFQSDSYPGREFRGEVRYIAPAVTSDNRSLVVEAVVPNPGYPLRPGMFVTADLELAETRSDLFIPRTAVRLKGEVASVFVVRDGAAREQIVALAEPAGDRVQVTAGLAAGDVIVTEPEKVHDGDRIAS